MLVTLLARLAGSWALVQSKVLEAVTALNSQRQKHSLIYKLRHSPTCQWREVRSYAKCTRWILLSKQYTNVHILATIQIAPVLSYWFLTSIPSQHIHL